MSDLKLNADNTINVVNGDLDTVSNYDENNKFTGQGYRQNLLVGLSINRGDWFLNINYGIGYRQQLGLAPKILLEIQATDFISTAFAFVESVQSLNFVYNNDSFNINFAVAVDRGLTLSGLLNMER